MPRGVAFFVIAEGFHKDYYADLRRLEPAGLPWGRPHRYTRGISWRGVQTSMSDQRKETGQPVMCVAETGAVAADASATTLFLPQAQAVTETSRLRLKKYRAKRRQLVFRGGRPGMVVVVKSDRDRVVTLVTVTTRGAFTVRLSPHQAHRVAKDGKHVSVTVLAGIQQQYTQRVRV